MSVSEEKPKAVLGIIGGSGLYKMDALEDGSWQSIETPYGLPSDDIRLGTIAGTPVAFLPRHGRGHRYTPSEVPYQANLWAMKQLGVQFVLSISAVGSMKEEITPGHLVIVDQFIDRTVGRARSFFGGGIVGHVGFADPVCEDFRKVVLQAARASDAPGVVDGGTYVCIEGPTFSTKAESHLFRSWGVDVIGMTNLPEARLAREAGMSYATVALATDYDCWHEGEEAVSVEAVIAILQQNVRVAQTCIEHVAKYFATENALQQSPYATAAHGAVMTDREVIPVESRRAVAQLFGDVLG